MKSFLPKSFSQKSFLFPALLVLLWVLAELIVNPVGEFPINDDWAYAKSVYYLYFDGIVKYFDWGAMILIGQTLWGTLFCLIFDFSFTTLRFSVLTLGAVGILFYYFIALKICRNEVAALLSSLVIAFNPLYFSLANSFMTDVPFLVFLLGTVFFYLLYLEQGKFIFFLLAFLFVLTATMIRQHGLLLTISLTGVLLYHDYSDWKKIIRVMLFGGLVFGIMWGFTFFLTEKNLLPASYAKISDLFKDWNWMEKFSYVIPRMSQLFLYSGLLLFPIAVIFLPAFRRDWRPLSWFFLLILPLILVIPVFLHRDDFPVGNYLYNLGLIPRVMKDSIWGLNWRVQLTDQQLDWIKFYAVFGAFTLFPCLLISNSDKHRDNSQSLHNPIKIISLLFLTGYAVFLIINIHFYDRYMLPFIIFISLLCIRYIKKIQLLPRIMALLTLSAMTLFSVAATHDYFAFNRARWTGLYNLMGKGISPKKIDGGFEFNAWYETGPQRYGDRSGKSWYFVEDDYYAITQGPLLGYKKYATHTYPTLLHFTTDSILVLCRSTSFKDSTVIYCNADSLNENQTCLLSSVPGIIFPDVQNRTDKVARSGRYSLFLDKDHLFGFSVNLTGVMPGDRFLVTVWTKDNMGKAGIVITSPDPNYLYFIGGVAEKRKDDWQQIMLEGNIFPDYKGHDVKIYLWNYGGVKVYFDDLKITWYKN